MSEDSLGQFVMDLEKNDDNLIDFFFNVDPSSSAIDQLEFPELDFPAFGSSSQNYASEVSFFAHTFDPATSSNNGSPASSSPSESPISSPTSQSSSSSSSWGDSSPEVHYESISYGPFDFAPPVFDHAADFEQQPFASSGETSLVVEHHQQEPNCVVPLQLMKQEPIVIDETSSVESPNEDEEKPVARKRKRAKKAAGKCLFYHNIMMQAKRRPLLFSGS